MNGQAIIIFDDGLGQFGPMTDLRACFQLRSGMATTAQRLEARFGKAAALWVPPRLAGVVAETAAVPVNRLPDAGQALLLNGRWLEPQASLQPAVGETIVESESAQIIAGLMSAAQAREFLESGKCPQSLKRREAKGVRLAMHPWDVLAAAKRTIASDILEFISPGSSLASSRSHKGVFTVGEHPIRIEATAKLYPGVVLDAEQGPIAVGARTLIRPGAVLCGPCSIGEDCVITDRALIKANTAIGPMCKFGGEVGGTIVQGFSNKSHDGHLGDSWVGEWVNFGAGTTNSNLLNTYDEVVMRIEPDGPRLRSGTQFLGAIVGDHVKTAICTRIMTGTAIGTGAMIASTAPPPTTVKRFAWLTDAGERSFRLDKFLDIMRTVMARRKVTAGKSYVDAVASLHAKGAGG